MNSDHIENLRQSLKTAQTQYDLIKRKSNRTHGDLKAAAKQQRDSIKQQLDQELCRGFVTAQPVQVAPPTPGDQSIQVDGQLGSSVQVAHLSHTSVPPSQTINAPQVSVVQPTAPHGPANPPSTAQKTNFPPPIIATAHGPVIRTQTTQLPASPLIQGSSLVQMSLISLTNNALEEAASEGDRNMNEDWVSVAFGPDVNNENTNMRSEDRADDSRHSFTTTQASSAQAAVVNSDIADVEMTDGRPSSKKRQERRENNDGKCLSPCGTHAQFSPLTQGFVMLPPTQNLNFQAGHTYHHEVDENNVDRRAQTADHTSVPYSQVRRLSVQADGHRDDGDSAGENSWRYKPDVPCSPPCSGDQSPAATPLENSKFPLESHLQVPSNNQFLYQRPPGIPPPRHFTPDDVRPISSEIGRHPLQHPADCYDLTAWYTIPPLEAHGEHSYITEGNGLQLTYAPTGQGTPSSNGNPQLQRNQLSSSRTLSPIPEYETLRNFDGADGPPPRSLAPSPLPGAHENLNTEISSSRDGRSPGPLIPSPLTGSQALPHAQPNSQSTSPLVPSPPPNAHVIPQMESFGGKEGRSPHSLTLSPFPIGDVLPQTKTVAGHSGITPPLAPNPTRDAPVVARSQSLGLHNERSPRPLASSPLPDCHERSQAQSIGGQAGCSPLALSPTSALPHDHIQAKTFGSHEGRSPYSQAPTPLPTTQIGLEDQSFGKHHGDSPVLAPSPEAFRAQSNAHMPGTSDQIEFDSPKVREVEVRLGEMRKTLSNLENALQARLEERGAYETRFRQRIPEFDFATFLACTMPIQRSIEALQSDIEALSPRVKEAEEYKDQLLQHARDKALQSTLFKELADIRTQLDGQEMDYNTYMGLAFRKRNATEKLADVTTRLERSSSKFVTASDVSATTKVGVSLGELAQDRTALLVMSASKKRKAAEESSDGDSDSNDERDDDRLASRKKAKLARTASGSQKDSRDVEMDADDDSDDSSYAGRMPASRIKYLAGKATAHERMVKSKKKASDAEADADMEGEALNDDGSFGDSSPIPGISLAEYEELECEGKKQIDDFLATGDPDTINGSIRLLVLKYQDFLPQSSFRSHKLALVMHLTAQNNYRCRYHLKYRAKKAYDGSGANLVEGVGFRPNMQSDRREDDHFNCGCPVEDVLFDFFFWKVWRARSTNPALAMYEEGMKGLIIPPRLRAFICQSFKRYTRITLDDVYKWSTSKMPFMVYTAMAQIYRLARELKMSGLDVEVKMRRRRRRNEHNEYEDGQEGQG